MHVLAIQAGALIEILAKDETAECVAIERKDSEIGQCRTGERRDLYQLPTHAKHATIVSITRFVSSGSRTQIEMTPASLAG